MRTRNKSILYFAAMLIVAGCSGKSAKELSEADYTLLKSINESFYDTSTAVDIALGDKIVPAASSEKLAKMVEMIKSSRCQREVKSREPSGRDPYTSDWGAEQYVTSGTCVLDLSQNNKFTIRDRMYKEDEFFDTTGDFKNESLVQSYRVDGYLKAATENNRTKIEGLFQFKNFKVKDLGLVGVRIKTTQAYLGSTGSGTAVLNWAAKGRSHVATVAWSGASRERQYRIDGKKVDEKTMQELFSAYGLMEIVDRSLKMR